jgi:hypothetical protein
MASISTVNVSQNSMISTMIREWEIHVSGTVIPGIQNPKVPEPEDIVQAIKILTGRAIDGCENPKTIDPTGPAHSVMERLKHIPELPYPMIMPPPDSTHLHGYFRREPLGGRLMWALYPKPLQYD